MENEEFDVVICGTGLTECILGGLLSSVGKKKVLQLDRNGYYGGESASLNLTNLYSKFRGDKAPPPELGANRDWNVDLIPKFVMACGNLVKVLLRTKVTRYLDWQVVEGTYVYQRQKAGWITAERLIHKVPATDMEALKSPMLSILEKNRVKNFLQFAAFWKTDDPATHSGFDPSKDSMKKVFAKFGLADNTIDFIGHAVALYTTDDYLTRPMGQTMEKIRLYLFSLSRYGKSPFIYPVYGLSTLPEGFSRLCAVHGGTFMLNQPVKSFEYGPDGRVKGVRAEDGTLFTCKTAVICDPTYVLGTPKVRLVGRVVRCICVTNKPPRETDNLPSSQIIIPQRQVGRHNDIYIATISHTHGVAKAGYYISLLSTTVETSDPHKELEPAFEVLGVQPLERFYSVSDVYEPTDDGKADGVFVSKSYDATSHFESAVEDVLQMWKRLTGEELDLTVVPDVEEDE